MVNVPIINNVNTRWYLPFIFQGSYAKHNLCFPLPVRRRREHILWMCRWRLGGKFSSHESHTVNCFRVQTLCDTPVFACLDTFWTFLGLLQLNDPWKTNSTSQSKILPPPPKLRNLLSGERAPPPKYRCIHSACVSIGVWYLAHISAVKNHQSLLKHHLVFLSECVIKLELPATITF